MNLTSPGAHGICAVIAVLLVAGCGTDESAAPWENRYFPREIIVEGEAWEHNWFDWQWTRCESTDCLPF